MPDLVGERLLGRYFLREHVGSGGMADVYAAWDDLRSAKMAVKVLRKDLAANPRFLRMFEKEADLLRKLEHPNIVHLYEFERDGEIFFLVMDWVQGTNLRQVLGDAKKPMIESELSPVLESVCSALNYAHRQGVYHCDVKPANILVHEDGKVLLTDFGVARLAADEGGGGTPAYMAPEQFSGDSIDARTDVYSLGITLFELLTGGELPYRGTHPDSVGTTTKEKIWWGQNHLPTPSLSKFNSAVPGPVEEVVLTAMANCKDDRFSTTMELREVFERAVMTAGRSPSTDRSSSDRTISLPGIEIRLPKPKPPRAPRPNRHHPPRRSNIAPELPSFPDIANVPGTSTDQPYLYGRGGEWAGQSIVIPDVGLSVGRSSKNQIRMRDRSVSRFHARFIRTRRNTYVRDEGSSLGTFVNNGRVLGPTKLKHRDIVRIGYHNEFEYREK